jgi:hypothetical protein
MYMHLIYVYSIRYSDSYVYEQFLKYLLAFAFDLLLLLARVLAGRLS